MYKYAVIIPTINKKNSIIQSDIFVYNITNISFYSGTPTVPSDVVAKSYTDIIKNITVNKPLAVRGYITTNNKVDPKTPAFDGRTSVAVFETMTEAIQWKIASVQVAYKAIAANVQEQLQKVKTTEEKIIKKHNKIKDIYPEYFL